MKIRAVGLAAFAALFLLIFTMITLQANSITNDDRTINTPQGGDPTPFSISVTLHPLTSAKLVYTNTDGTVAELNFPPHTTDVTRTIYFITTTDTYAHGMIFSGYGFGLIPTVNDIIDKQFELQQPVSITIQYPDSIIPTGLSERQVGFYYSSNDGWIPAGDTCELSQPIYHDVEGNIFSGNICSFAYYAVLGVHRHYLPVLMRDHIH